MGYIQNISEADNLLRRGDAMRSLRRVRNEGDFVFQENNEGRVLIETLEPRLLLSNYLVTSLDDSGEGTLRAAIEAANANSGADTITFDEQLAGETIVLDGTTLVVRDDLTIQAPAGGITIDADGKNGVIGVGGKRSDAWITVYISGLTLTGGHEREEFAWGGPSGGSGGGIWNQYAFLTLENCIITNNDASTEGGGVYNDADLTLINCLISNNHTSFGGGGIENYRCGKLTVINSTVSENRSSGGCGIFNYGECIIIGSVITGNYNNDFGGGLHNHGTMTVIDSLISNNISKIGGGVCNDGEVDLVNCLIVGNSAQTGGGIEIFSGSMTLANCTIANNLGGGINNLVNEYVTGGLVVLNNTIVSQNTDQSGSSLNISGDYTNNFSLIGGTPGFADAENGDYSLAATSICINAGDNTLAAYPDGTAIETDLVGNQRIYGDTVDIGAYELQEVAIEALVVDDAVLDMEEDAILNGSLGGEQPQSLTYTLVEGVQNGKLVFNPDGTFTYTPSANWNGTDTFTFKVNDGALDSNIATVTITVMPINDTPSGLCLIADMDLNTPSVINLAGFDIESPSNLLVFTVTRQPQNGQLTCLADGIYTYQPDSGYCGEDSFAYTVSDGQATSMEYMVSLEISGYSVILNAGKKYSFYDASGDLVTVKLTGEGSVALKFESESSDLSQITLNDTTLKSKLTITTKGRGSGTTVGSIVLDGGYLKSLTAKTTDITGTGISSTSANGYIGSITVDDVENGADIDLLGAGYVKGVKIKADVLGDGTDITLGSPLKKLKVTDWLGGELNARTAAAIQASNNFQADILLTGMDKNGYSLKTFKVGQLLSDSLVRLAGMIGKVKYGDFDDVDILENYVA